jgi:glycosyltransferase involved in cell wall biosynthesis
VESVSAALIGLGLAWSGLAALVAALNLLLMARPNEPAGPKGMVALIPARNEQENLSRLVPKLIAQGLPVVVFDDESTDATARVAQQAGALVIRPESPLPPGWTGKNRAADALAQTAETHPEWAWWVMLDADVDPAPDFAARLAGLVARYGEKYPVISGIPRICPGQGIEPLFMAWIGWIILASNPFGLAFCTGWGHNAFLNGQVTVWRADVYRRIRPNAEVRAHVTEDLMMGRLLAREKVPVLVANLSAILAVRMYRTWRECWDGFSKNAYQITNSFWGTGALATALALLAVAAVLSPWVYALLIVSAGYVAIAARTGAWWSVPLMPVALLIGTATLVRSAIWHRTGRVRWKGRAYPSA